MLDGMTLAAELARVAALRAELWDCGLRPLAIHNHDARIESPGKAPFGSEWEDRARRDPPEAAIARGGSEPLNTGILCDGLRAVDIDVDDRALAGRLRAIGVAMLGDAPMRYRDNSGRCLLVYAAAEGEPPKRVLPGAHGKIEVLGRGQQFVGFGVHPSGVELRWHPEPLTTFPRDALLKVTEEQVTAFLAACAPLLRAKPSRQGEGDAPEADDHEPSARGPSADPLDVAAALAVIPNDGPPNWDWWNKVGLAAHAATGGSAEGRATWFAWSAKNRAHDPNACRERWKHYGYRDTCERTIGAGTLFHLAKQACPGWRKPSDYAAEARRRGSDWPAPDLALISDHRQLAPDFPADVLPDFWARWAADTAEAAGAPLDFVAMALLAGSGATLGNARWGSPWPGWAEPPVVNVALVGRPSSGKSPAMDALHAMLAAIEADDNSDFGERQREWKRDALAAKERCALYEAEVKRAVKDKCPPPDMPADAAIPNAVQRRRLLTTDPTVAKAERMSAASPRGLLLIRDELAGWLAGMDRYSGGGDRPFWLQAYGGRPWTPDRVKDGENEIAVRHLTWGIMGGIQPDRVASLLLAGDDDGLAARFLFTWPEPQYPNRPRAVPDHDGAQAALARLRVISWATSPEAPRLPFAPRAAGLMDEWRTRVAAMEGDAAGLFLSWIGKLPGFAVRLATILEHLDWAAGAGSAEPQAIGETAALRALTLLDDYAVPMARRVFGDAAMPQAERDGRRLGKWLLAQRPLPEVANAKELRRMANGPGIPDAARMEAALGELEAAGWVRSAPARAEGYGRQRKDYAINPALARASA